MKHESQHPELISNGKGKPFKKSISLGALGLGKLWRRRSVTITEYDPCYKVVYLGNVLTGIAKGMYHIIIIIIFKRFRLSNFSLTRYLRHLSIWLWCITSTSCVFKSTRMCSTIVRLDRKVVSKARGTFVKYVIIFWFFDFEPNIRTLIL